MSPWQQYADICCWDEVVILLKLTLMSAFLMKMRTCCFMLKRKENREKKTEISLQIQRKNSEDKKK